ncbi:MAG: hypothetical protein Q4G03_02720 [Planctomycetia bacterium]|nr:hypothetical protein [Planctomycetia bacterium]
MFYLCGLNRRDALRRAYAGKVPLIFLLALLVLVIVILAVVSRQNQKKVRHGVSQTATIQDKAQQNEELIRQVVQAAEEQDKHSDPTFLRGALGRINTWLAEQPVSIDFEPDQDFDALAQRVDSLKALVKQARDAMRPFTAETGQPTEDDCQKLQAALVKLNEIIGPMAQETRSNTLAAFTLFTRELTEKLESAREYQFADPTETFKTQIQQLAGTPQYEFYNFENLYTGLDEFQRALKIDGVNFIAQDVDYLRSCVWARNVFLTVKGERQDDLDIVLALFDWTVKNVVLTGHIPGAAGMISQYPWQTMLIGQGDAMDRAIVFIELLRQHQLDAFVLRPRNDDAKDFPIVVGVILQNNVLLFLPEFGLPIPALEEGAMTYDSNLKFNKLATLEQVAQNDAILRQFDLTETFPAKAEQFKEVVAYLPTTPFHASSRMLALEPDFSSRVNTTLHSSYSLQKERVSAMKNIVEVQKLYEATAPLLEQAIFPHESDELTQVYMLSLQSSGNLEVSDSSASNSVNDNIADYTGSDDSAQNMETTRANTVNSPLWIGKVRYLAGNFVDENGAAHWLQQGRVSDRVLKQEEASILTNARAYVQSLVEAASAQNQQLTEEQLQALLSQTVVAMQQDLMIKRYVKILTSYYLALLAESTDKLEAAQERLNDASLRVNRNSGSDTVTLSDAWKYAAEYLRARVLERQGAVDGAISRLNSANVPGAKCRAKFLAQAAGRPYELTNEKLAETAEASTETTEQETPTQESQEDAQVQEDVAPTERATEQEPTLEEPSAEETSADAEPQLETEEQVDAQESHDVNQEPTLDDEPTDARQ